MLSREPTLRPPPSNAINAGDSAMSNLAARTPLSAPSAPAPMQKQSTGAPTQPALKVVTLIHFLTAASPPPHLAPTAPRTTRQVTGIARPALYLPPVPLPTSQKRMRPSPLPPVAHIIQPPASSLRPTRMPWTFSQTEPAPPLHLSHPLPLALSPPWSLLPQGPLFALRSLVPRYPSPGLVAPNPMGSPAPSLPPENSRPRAGKCPTTHLLHLGAGPPHVTCPLFSTTASGAGMCFSPCLILLLQLSALLI